MGSNDPALEQSHFDEHNFEILFTQHFLSLCAYCQYKFGFSLDLSKEVVHTAFIKLWNNRSTLSPDLPVKAYLNSIIVNHSLDLIRHEKVKQRHQAYLIDSFSERAETGFEELGIKQLSEDIDKAIAALPLQMRKIFELSRYEGLKYAAIAERLSISVKTVETQMSRALAKLRDNLADYLSLVFLALSLFK